MATYKDGLKNLLSSDRFTSRATPFRLAMMARIRDRARRDEPVLVPNRFYRKFQLQDFIASEGDERMWLGRRYFEAWRFRFFHRDGTLRPRHLGNNWLGWAGYYGESGWPRYRSGFEKRKKESNSTLSESRIS